MTQLSGRRGGKKTSPGSKPGAANPRVLIAGHLPPPMSGIGTYYQTLLGSSLPQKIQVQFIDTSLRRRVSAKTGSWTFSNIVSALADCFRFAKKVIEFKPEISHIATAFGLSFVKHSVCVITARLFGSRVLLHPHCSFYFLYEQQSKSWQWFVRTIIRSCDGVIVLSKEWENLHGLVPECPIFYLPNAIDTSKFADVASEKCASEKIDQDLNVLYLGYLGKAKGTFDLIEAARIIHEKSSSIVFYLVGHELTAGEQNQINENVTADDLEMCVQVRPTADDIEKNQYFRGADIFVYPSHHEGMPMAVIEAMACGLPIIATSVGGLPDLVVPGVNGMLVPPAQPELLAEAILELGANPKSRYLMQKESLRFAREKFDIDNLVSSLIGIYHGVLE